MRRLAILCALLASGCTLNYSDSNAKTEAARHGSGSSGSTGTSSATTSGGSTSSGGGTSTGSSTGSSGSSSTGASTGTTTASSGSSTGGSGSTSGSSASSSSGSGGSSGSTGSSGGPCDGVADGGPCDDGNPCTRVDVCVNGACGGAIYACASNGCDVATCDGDGGCVRAPANENGPCNDGQSCTLGDVCHGGVCSGTPYSCAPATCFQSAFCTGDGGCGSSLPSTAGTPCTNGLCDGSGQCMPGCMVGSTFYGAGQKDATGCGTCDPAVSTTSLVVDAGAPCGPGEICRLFGGTPSCVTGCWIQGAYVSPGTVNAANPCESCDPTASTSAWSPRTGLACDGGTGAVTICSDTGTCAAGCFIGAFYPQGAAVGPCGVCDASYSTVVAKPSAAANSACGSGAVCVNAMCVCASTLIPDSSDAGCSTSQGFSGACPSSSPGFYPQDPDIVPSYTPAVVTPDFGSAYSGAVASQAVSSNCPAGEQLPTVRELEALIDYGPYAVPLRSMGGLFDGGTFWTGDVSGTTKLQVDMGSGQLVTSQNPATLLCVTPPTACGAAPQQRFMVIRTPNSGSGMVADQATGLIWAHDALQPRNWYPGSCLNQLPALPDAGSPWRLPSIKELQSVVNPVDYASFASAMGGLPDGGEYWSSSPESNYVYAAQIPDGSAKLEAWSANPAPSAMVLCVHGAP